MAILKSIVQILAIISGSLAALGSILLFLRLHWPSPALWILKICVSAISPILVLIGVLCIIIGLITRSTFICILGFYVSAVFLVHIYSVTRPPASTEGFDEAFGPDWESHLSAAERKHFIAKRISLRLPKVSEPLLDENISFATVPGTHRNLLCDVWQPPENVAPSGLAFIYVHGAAWSILDKDVGTRPFFSHLAAQGHVVMDVANRLAPETDLMGMVYDVKRAIVWMKENANNYSVNPNRIVLGGGSSGAHIVLLAAYTTANPEFTPPDLASRDMSVHGVVSFYGPADLERMYYHTNQHVSSGETPEQTKEAVPPAMPSWVVKKMGKSYARFNFEKGFAYSSFQYLLGGNPDEVPERYSLFSPLTHVHEGCPPTLLLHGDHDVMAPVESTRMLYDRLKKEKVKTVMHVIPQTDHAFDLVFPRISPSAQNAIYDVERFLALQCQPMARPKVEEEKFEYDKIQW